MAPYMIWLIATAVMTITVLVIGTLKAADLVPSRTSKNASPTRPAAWVRSAPGAPATGRAPALPERAEVQHHV